MDVAQIAEQLSELAERAVQSGKRLGADAVEVGVSHDEGLSVTVRMGELESIERQQDRGLGITVYRDGRKGSASTSDFTGAGVDMAVEKAASIASFTAADPYSGLPEKSALAVDPPDLALWHPWEIEAARAEELALAGESAARGHDSRIDNSEGATVATGGGVRAYANSLGFVGAYPTSSHSISVSVVARQGESLERDYWYTAARDPDELDGPESVGESAARRAVGRLGSRRMATGTMPVLFAPELARSLFGHLVAALSGTSQYRKASFLLDAAGDRIFADNIDVVEDPHIPKAFGSAPFDSEGVATRRRDLISGGVVTGYVLSSYSARRLGLDTTGNAGGAHALLVTPTAGDLDSVLAGCDEAFLVTELLGQGVNIVTGDYSRGAAGFRVEKGEIVHPVSEVTIAGNLRDMFASIAAVGSDIDRRGAIRCGCVLVDGMTVAGE